MSTVFKANLLGYTITNFIKGKKQTVQVSCIIEHWDPFKCASLFPSRIKGSVQGNLLVVPKTVKHMRDLHDKTCRFAWWNDCKKYFTVTPCFRQHTLSVVNLLTETDDGKSTLPNMESSCSS